LISWLAAVAMFARQTPPVQPNVTPVPQPPAITLPAPPHVEVTTPITAEDAARIALLQQPSVLIARAQVLAAQGRTQQARSDLLPNVTLNSSYTRTTNFRGNASSGSNTGGGSSGGFNSQVSVDQLLFDFNRTVNNVRAAAAREAAARQDLTATESDVVLAVKDAYYAYQQDTQLVAVQEANVASSQAQLTFAQARLTAGLGPPADVLQAATNVAAATQALAQARQTALNSQIALALEMGVDPRTPLALAPAEEPAPPSDDVNSLVSTALEQRPDIRSAQATIRAAGYSVSAARAGNLPRVGLTGSLGSRGPNDPFASNSGSVGISVSWNVFDAGFTAGAVRIARADVEIARAQLQQASLAAIRDVSQGWVNLHSAEQRVAIAQAQVANATESLRLAEGRFRAGVSTFLEVTQAQTALTSAQVNLVNAQTLVQFARAQLAHAIGAPVSAPAGR